MKKGFLVHGILALSMIGCSTPIINTDYDFLNLEKEYKSFSTKALSDAYVKRMFGKYLGNPVNSVQLNRQLEFSRYLKTQSDTSYETSLKNMFLTTPVLYDQMTGITAVSDKMSSESATFGTYVIGLSPYPPAPSNIIYVKANSTGLNNGTSWANAYTSLQTALSNAVIDNDIWVAAGTYKPGTLVTSTFQLKSGVDIYGGFAGNETSFNQRNFNTNIVILSGDKNSSNTANTGDCRHVVTGITGATLDGVTVKYGYSDGVNGAGMYNVSSSPIIKNVIFSDNIGINSSYGAGMYNSGSSPILTNVIFSNNTANYGGGLYNADSSPILTNVIFYNNYAYAGTGGGIWNNSSTPTLTNITFSNNSATLAGNAMYNFNSTVIVKNSIFWGNNTIYHSTYNGLPLKIEYSDLENGLSSITGDGAIQNLTGSGLTTVNFTTIGHNINTDPKFVNASDPDGTDNIFGTSDDGLALQTGSPAINSGINTGAPSIDIIGLIRPQGITVDMGAYEMLQ